MSDTRPKTHLGVEIDWAAEASGWLKDHKGIESTAPGSHAERAHAQLGPSQSSRWRKCIASIELCAALPDPPSGQAALDGTFAHEWAEHCLRNSEYDATQYIGMALEPTVGARKLTPDVVGNINVYLQLVERLLAPEDELFVEQRFSLAKYFGGTPDGDGTADCAIYKPATRHLHVIDYKNGFGMVEVEGNTQAIQYALGAWEIFKERGVEKITIWIVQPKLGAPRDWPISAADLWDHGEDLKDDYAKTLIPGQAFVPGKHCKWCKGNIYGKCAALRQHSEREASSGFERIHVHEVTDDVRFAQHRLTREDLGAMLVGAEPMRVYLKALDELAESEAKAGRVPTGRKWVATPGRRAWSAELGGDVAVAKAIQSILPGAAVWDEKLKTAPALEKELGKADFKQLEHLVTKSSGGFSLVAEDDRRPAVEYGRASEGFEVVT